MYTAACTNNAPGTAEKGTGLFATVLFDEVAEPNYYRRCYALKLQVINRIVPEKALKRAQAFSRIIVLQLQVLELTCVRGHLRRAQEVRKGFEATCKLTVSRGW